MSWGSLPERDTAPGPSCSGCTGCRLPQFATLTEIGASQSPLALSKCSTFYLLEGYGLQNSAAMCCSHNQKERIVYLHVYTCRWHSLQCCSRTEECALELIDWKSQKLCWRWRSGLEKGADVNAQGSKYGNALQAALVEGYQEIAKMLLEQGADVNAPGGPYGNALRAASGHLHECMASSAFA